MINKLNLQDSILKLKNLISSLEESIEASTIKFSKNKNYLIKLNNFTGILGVMKNNITTIEMHINSNKIEKLTDASNSILFSSQILQDLVHDFYLEVTKNDTDTTNKTYH